MTTELQAPHHVFTNLLTALPQSTIHLLSFVTARDWGWPRLDKTLRYETGALMMR